MELWWRDSNLGKYEIHSSRRMLGMVSGKSCSSEAKHSALMGLHSRLHYYAEAED